MGSSHFSSGFLRDLPMEINLAFYPPPTVIVPEIGIPELRKYEYKFDRERTAIRRYGEEQNKLRLESERRQREMEEAEQQELKRRQNELERINAKEAAKTMAEVQERVELGFDNRQIDPRNSEEDNTEEANLNLTIAGIGQMALKQTSSSQAQDEEKQKLPPPEPITIPIRPMPSSSSVSQQNYAFPPLRFNSTLPASTAPESSNGIKKSEFEAIPCSSSSSSLSSTPWPVQNPTTPSQQQQKYTLNGLEEFETKRDLFDLMELRSLDDRRELEKLLMNGVNWGDVGPEGGGMR